MLDDLLVVFWVLAYALIIWGGSRPNSSRPCMPLVAGCLNFCWEVNAVIVSHGFWGHILWLLLDVLILWKNLRILRERYGRRGVVSYLAIMAGVFLLLAVCFRAPGWDSMLITSYVIDVVMAAEFVLVAKRISPNCRAPIALCKLLGDLFAWIAYWEASPFVAVAGAVVLVLNLVYLCWCLEEKERTRGKASKRSRKRR